MLDLVEIYIKVNGKIEGGLVIERDEYNKDRDAVIEEIRSVAEDYDIDETAIIKSIEYVDDRISEDDYIEVELKAGY